MSPPSNRIISHKTAMHRTPFYERTAYLNFKWHNRISHFMKRRRRTISIMTISWLKEKLTKNKATIPSNYRHKDLRKDHQGNQLGNHFNQLTIINRARFLMKLKFRDLGAKWQSAIEDMEIWREQWAIKDFVLIDVDPALIYTWLTRYKNINLDLHYTENAKHLGYQHTF